jgi:hypothetical protein
MANDGRIHPVAAIGQSLAFSLIASPIWRTKAQTERDAFGREDL